ncbi:MAG: hypothetical protein EZS28_018203 [Streblomastix strix]|uniref:Uncharacterized protein n=1 Tax=Streblomastix strix TaxID=222440 RepID=A0A5J4VVS3_9EUKA|nr:MAG: hypothetical protein EZS28_018203 [Streblomastix strix]
MTKRYSSELQTTTYKYKELFECELNLRAPASGPSPEIQAFLADQSFVPPTFDKDDPRFMAKLDGLKLYILSKQMAFVDIMQRFSAMNSIFSKPETQQKMTYAQVANTSLDSPQRYFRVPVHSRRAQPQISMILTGTFTHNRNRRTNEYKVPFRSLRAALVAQDLVDITRRTQEGASAGDTEYRHRIRVNQVALDHLGEICVIIDIATINIAIDMANFRRKQPKQFGAQNFQHAYIYCARTITLAEGAIIAEIHHIILDQPPSRNLIEAYLMCLSAGAPLRQICISHSTQLQNRNQAMANFRSATAQSPCTHDNAPYYGRRNNCGERGHMQLNDNLRAQNRERRVEQNLQWLISMEGEEREQNGALSCMEKEEVLEDDDAMLGQPLIINTQIQLFASWYRATIIIPQQRWRPVRFKLMSSTKWAPDY